MKVVLVNHSDTLGGASVVTYRLMSALRRAGVDARMVVYTKTSDSQYVEKVSSRFVRGLRFMGECISCAMANGWDRENLFKISVAATGCDISKLPVVRDADVICLNWVNQGMLSMSDIRGICALGKPVVWTMHDMWCFTGVCHHAGKCTGYRSGCGYCPMLRHGKVARDRSSVLAWRKAHLYGRFPITFVAVSNWLSDCAHCSSLLEHSDIRVIPNAFPVDFFVTEETYQIKEYDLDYSKKLLLFGAARLDDPIKGIDYCIDALNKLFDHRPDIANNSMAVFFGDLRDPQKLKRLRFPHRHIGRINDAKILRRLYASSAVVISSSLVETLPGTLIEGQAAGCVPVTFGVGGQSDIIEHLETGYIAKYLDSGDLARGILWAIENPLDRQMLHDSVDRKFNSDTVAKQYIDLFEELIASHR